MRVLVALLINFMTISAFAVSEGASYEKTIATAVTPFLASNLKYSSFKAHDGKRIVFATLRLPASRGLVVISPGRSESILGFSEVIYDLAQRGFSVAIIDQRGQGFSERVAATSDVGTVDHFSDYSDDFERFVKLAVGQNETVFLMADSMGSAIALEFMRHHPNTFAKALIAVPMLKIKTAPIPYSIAPVVAGALWLVGRGAMYLPSTGPYDLHRKFSENDFTDSAQRFDLDVRLTSMHPQIAVGGASANWVIEAIREGAALRKNAASVTTPMLMLQAGNDAYVDNRAEEVFCAQARRCELVKFPTAKHWIYFSQDRIRDQIFQLIDRWFTKAAHDPRG